MKKLALPLVFMACFVSGQKKIRPSASVPGNSTPRLVVGLVVDQMRWDYLYRFQNRYGQGGFNRLLREGFAAHNLKINYVPTVTAIGHASIYTGTVPSIHGIAGNDWFDRADGKTRYVTTDTSVQPVGTTNVKVGQNSPLNLWSTTLGDQMRLSNEFRSKVVGISLKDRAAILPAGQRPTGAFWYDDSTGDFVTSTYYMNELPAWLKDFNAKKWTGQLVKEGWNTLYPIETYTQSSPDRVDWEHHLGSMPPVFPYTKLAEEVMAKPGLIRTTPFGNTLTLKLAEAALDGYQLGQDQYPDLLAINLASTDYVGHAFGPNSVEIEDTYLRLDKELEAFLQMLDQKVGQGNYTLFITADHGGAHSVGYLQDKKMFTGFFDETLRDNLRKVVDAKFPGVDFIQDINNYQIYLNHDLIHQKGTNLNEIKQMMIAELRKDPRILYALDLELANAAPVPNSLREQIINGYNHQRGGDIQVISKDNFLPNYAKKGTTHSVWNSYDSHIPFLLMGPGVKRGSSHQPRNMTDIAPTITSLLRIEAPSGNIGNPITEAIHDKERR